MNSAEGNSYTDLVVMGVSTVEVFEFTRFAGMFRISLYCRLIACDSLSF